MDESDEYDVLFNLMFWASILIFSVGVVGLISVFLNVPWSGFTSFPLLLKVLLYLVFIGIGLMLMVGMYRGRRWVLYLVGVLLAGLIVSQVAALVLGGDVFVGTFNLLVSVGVSVFIAWVVTRPSMKENFSK